MFHAFLKISYTFRSFLHVSITVTFYFISFICINGRRLCKRQALTQKNTEDTRGPIPTRKINGVECPLCKELVK